MPIAAISFLKSLAGRIAILTLGFALFAQVVIFLIALGYFEERQIDRALETTRIAANTLVDPERFEASDEFIRAYFENADIQHVVVTVRNEEIPEGQRLWFHSMELWDVDDIDETYRIGEFTPFDYVANALRQLPGRKADQTPDR